MTKSQQEKEEIINKFRENYSYTKNGQWLRKVDGYIDEEDNFVVKAGKLEVLQELKHEVEGLVIEEPVVSFEGHPVLSLDWRKYLKLLDLIQAKIEELRGQVSLPNIEEEK